LWGGQGSAYKGILVKGVFDKVLNNKEFLTAIFHFKYLFRIINKLEKLEAPLEIVEARSDSFDNLNELSSNKKIKHR